MYVCMCMYVCMNVCMYVVHDMYVCTWYKRIFLRGLSWFVLQLQRRRQGIGAVTTVKMIVVV